jgi:hypothetical protein
MIEFKRLACALGLLLLSAGIGTASAQEIASQYVWDCYGT